MSNSHHQISTRIAERFVDAIAKIKAEAARVIAEQKENIETQTEEKIAGYCEEINQLKNQLEQISRDHAEDITKITSEAQESIAKEKTRADEADKRMVKARTEIGEAITEQRKKIETKAEALIAETKTEYGEQLTKIKSEADEAIAKEKTTEEVETDSVDSATEEKAEEISEEVPAEAEAQTQEQSEQTEPVPDENIETVEEVNSETSETTEEVETESADNAVEEKPISETEDRQPATGEVSKTIEKMVELTNVLPSGSDSLLSTLCAEDIMNKALVWADLDDSVQQALTMIKQTDNGYLIVGKNETIEGIVSNSDLNGAVSAYLRPEFAKWRRPEDDATLQIKLKWIMSRLVHIIKPETPLATIMSNMCRLSLLSLPVVDPQGKVLGLVTEAGIFEALLKQKTATNLSASSKADQQQPTPDNLSDPTKRTESSLATAE